MVEILGLQQALVRMLDQPNGPGEHGNRDLDRGGVVLLAEQLARLLDGELRTVPEGAVITHEERAQFVDTLDDLLAQQAPFRLDLEVVSHHLAHA